MNYARQANLKAGAVKGVMGYERMRLLQNIGTDRVIDLVLPKLKTGFQLDVVCSSFSLFAFADMQAKLNDLKLAQLVLPASGSDLGFLGGDADRASRNKLQSRWLAKRCAEWVCNKAEIRLAKGSVPQGTAVIRDAGGNPQQVVMGSFGLTTAGLGITPGNPLNLIQASDTADEAAMLSQWFDMQWNSLPPDSEAKRAFVDALDGLSASSDPFSIYSLILVGGADIP